MQGFVNKYNVSTVLIGRLFSTEIYTQRLEVGRKKIRSDTQAKIWVTFALAFGDVVEQKDK